MSFSNATLALAIHVLGLDGQPTTVAAVAGALTGETGITAKHTAYGPTYRALGGLVKAGLAQRTTVGNVPQYSLTAEGLALAAPPLPTQAAPKAKAAKKAQADRPARATKVAAGNEAGLVRRRTNRATGLVTSVYDTEAAGCTFNGSTGRYLVVVEGINRSKGFPTLAQAKVAARNPSTWCTDCAKLAADRQAA